jgi:FkbM family methyltransferase
MKNIRKFLRKARTIYSYSKIFGWDFAQSWYLNSDSKQIKIFGKKLAYADRFWLLHGLKEIFIDKVYLFKSTSNSPLILDCGANIGLSAIFFKQTHPNARVVAFEPDPSNFALLNENVKTFSLKDVELVNKAIWKEDTVLSFSSFGNVGSKIVSAETVDNVISVPAVSLSSYLKNNIVDFLKIDIEGAEYEVLKSCVDDLKNVQNLFIEYHSLPTDPQILAEMLLLLRNAGFRIYIKEAWENLKKPFISQKTVMFDLQLNIFAYRK